MTTKVSSGLISADAASVDLNIDANTLYVDVSENSVGIGETAPLAKLHIKRGDSGLSSLNAAGDHIFLENTGANGTGITLASGNTANGSIIFGDQDSNYRGVLIYDHSADAMKFVTAGSETMRIASDGKVGIGTTTPQYQMLTVKSSSSTGNNFRFETGSELAVVSVDDSGDLTFFAHGADERIKFLNGVGSGTVLAAFDSDGLKFGSDTAAANALDDYDTGSWTPSSSASLTIQYANYTKIGQLVYVNADITVGSTSGNASFNISLPFNGTDSYHAGAVNYNTASLPDMVANLDAQSGIYFRSSPNGSNITYSVASGVRLIFSLVYTTNS